MPQEYILREVFDHKHCILVLSNSRSFMNEDIIGAVCYRPAFEERFIEIVFFAVNAELFYIKGFGAFIFNFLKESCKFQYKKFMYEGDVYIKSNIEIDNLDIFKKQWRTR
jgi:histone acetyltransferase